MYGRGRANEIWKTLLDDDSSNGNHERTTRAAQCLVSCPGDVSSVEFGKPTEINRIRHNGRLLVRQPEPNSIRLANAI